MRLCVVRGPHLHAADAGNYYGAVEHGVDLTFAAHQVDTSEMRLLYPKAHFMDYAAEFTDIVEGNFDVLDVPDMFYPFSSMLAARHNRVMHLAWDNQPGRNTVTRQLGKAWRHTTRSTMARQTLLHDGVASDLIKVIYGAIDTELFYYSPLENRSKAVLFAGRNTPEKGLTHIMWAMIGVDAELWITTPWLTEEQRALASRNGLQVKYLGHCDRIQMRQVLQSCRCLAFPSLPLVAQTPQDRWTEQFGQLLIEAMSCGTPVVAYDSGAIKEVLGSEIPQAHTCGDWSILGAMINELASRNDHLWQACSDHNRDRAVSVFDQSKIGGQIADWYT